MYVRCFFIGKIYVAHDRFSKRANLRHVCLYVRLEYKEIFKILESLDILDLYHVMSMFKLKIKLCIVASAAQNDEFERFAGFCVGCYYTL